MLGVEREVASSEFRVEASEEMRYVGDLMEPLEDVPIQISSEVHTLDANPTFLIEEVDIIYHDRWTNPYEGYATAIVSIGDAGTSQTLIMRLVHISTRTSDDKFWSELKEKLAKRADELVEELRELVLKKPVSY